MWVYEKKLQYPVRIRRPDPRAASIIVTQLGGPDGEVGASLRYLNQRFTMSNNKAKAIRFSTLNALCRELQCQPGDILEYVEDDGQQEE